MIINKEIIDELKNKTPIEGDCMILNYEIKESKYGKPYIDGFLCNKSKIQFKIWDGPYLELLKDEDYAGRVISLIGEVNDFNGSKSIIVKSFEENTEAKLEDFMIGKYTDEELEEYKNYLIDTLKNNLSEKGYKLIDTILLSNEERFYQFCTEFSAKTHHDNCVGGLLAHTTRMLKIGNSLYNLYKEFWDEMGDDMKDLYFIGITIHDIGKIREMHFGEYQYQSSVTHRYLGVEMVSEYREMIEELYDDKWFYDLLSVLIQHHHIYGEKAKTVIAFIVFLVDSTEAQMTNILEHVQQEKRITSSGEIIWLDKETPLTL